MRFSASFTGLLALVPFFVSQVYAQAETSLTLDPSVIAQGFALTGQEVPADGQVASLTSTNNFINFCAGKTITDGKQIQEGSCNPAPMGDIPSKENIPASKFTFPKNGDATIVENVPFVISMAVARWQLGNFVNAQGNYYSAPQQLNGQGQVIGHSHVVIEKLDSLDQTTITDPNSFAFFKGVNGGANNGIVTADVTDGLPAGFYRLASINAAANHQPILAPVAQHGSMDDMVYFTVVAAGAAAPEVEAPPADNNNNNGGNNNNNNGGNNNNNGGNNGGNNNAPPPPPPPAAPAGVSLNAFTEALGGINAPAVTPAADGKFAVVGQGATFNDLRSAVTRSCDVQNNQCADNANRTGNAGGVDVGACGQQQQRCLALTNNLRRRSLRFARDY